MFIVIILTLILMVILNSKFSSYCILIFQVYDSKFHIIYEIPIICRFLVLIVTSLIILSWQVSFYPSTMESFHCHRCWLLFFVVFLCFLIPHECDHLSGLLITLEVLSWAIILLLFIIIVSHCCWLLYFFIVFSLPRMSAPTCWDHWLHWKWFAELSYYRYISTLFFSLHNGIISPSPLLIVIFWFLMSSTPTDEYKHSFGSLIISEILCWEIILSLYCYI